MITAKPTFGHMCARDGTVLNFVLHIIYVYSSCQSEYYIINRYGCSTKGIHIYINLQQLKQAANKLKLMMHAYII